MFKENFVSMWKNLFSMENPVMQALGVACDLLVLNVLAALCSLPLVTAGPVRRQRRRR